MLIVERQKQLLAVLTDQTSASLEALAAALGVSASTVRRDVESLEREGLVTKTHGGVILRGGGVPVAVMRGRMAEHSGAKRAIGEAAGRLVQPGMTLYVGGGSTVQYALERMEARPLQVVTNALSVANHFAADERVELVMPGGTHGGRTGVLMGTMATRALAGLHMDLMLFSCTGIFEGAVFESNLGIAELEQVAIRQSARRVLLADAGKFGKRGLARVCGVEEVETVLTDGAIGPDWRDVLVGRLMVV